MSGRASRSICSACKRLQSRRVNISPSTPHLGPRRQVQIYATPASQTPELDSTFSYDSANAPSQLPDAQFEVLGSPNSLLSVQLSALQNLYTRRGTLVAVNGKVENTESTLSVLEPFRRAALGIPFLYQKISSTTPIKALISTKSPTTSFTIVQLDGRLDWIVAQRQALLAWTGQALSVRPRLNRHLGLAFMGNSLVTGRGLLALVGNGQIFQVKLRAGEEYVVHPSNIIAYTVSQAAPSPYRFKSSIFRIQVPSVSLGSLIPDIQFFKSISESSTWKTISQFFFNLRTLARRSIWGDRLFMRFQGPTTILLQSRGSRLTDSLTAQDVNEIADSPAGSVQNKIQQDSRRANQDSKDTASPPPAAPKETRISFASVGGDGKVKFGDN